MLTGSYNQGRNLAGKLNGDQGQENEGLGKIDELGENQ